MIIKLKYKVLLIYLVFGFLIFSITAFAVSPFLRKYQFNTLQREIKTQLAHIDLALTTFIKNIQVHAEILSMNPLVRTRNDQHFTNFLHADVASFRYNYSNEEILIINTFNNYRMVHPYIHSVYMGRENGSFVRSHKRARPTKYDPRVRPWYLLAKNNANSIMKTSPYRSITTNDINIGIVKALVDNQKKFYGAVGIDVTLKDLTRYMANVKLVRNGYMMLLDKKGTILVGGNGSESFKFIGSKISNYKNIYQLSAGYLRFINNGRDYYCFYYSSNILGWKILSIIPVNDIHGELNQIIFRFIVYFLLSLILLSVLTLFGLNKYVLNPLARLCGVTREITKTKNYHSKLYCKNKDELGELAASFNIMIEGINENVELLQNSKKQIEEMLEKANDANRLKSEFLAMMSHEIRTPLTGIIGFSSIFSKCKNLEEMKENADAINRSAVRLNEMLSNILELSAAQAGKIIELKYEQFDIEVMIKDIILLLENRIKNQNNKIVYEVRCEKNIYSCPLRIQQVLFNLIGNSIKFTNNGEITIILAKNEGYYVFEIIDTGIGIEASNFEKIFDVFQQLDGSINTRKYQGVGLGLSVSKKIVEDLGGKIWVESEYGKGSAFYFTIPEIKNEPD